MIVGHSAVVRDVVGAATISACRKVLIMRKTNFSRRFLQRRRVRLNTVSVVASASIIFRSYFRVFKPSGRFGLYDGICSFGNEVVCGTKSWIVTFFLETQNERKHCRMDYISPSKIIISVHIRVIFCRIDMPYSIELWRIP